MSTFCAEIILSSGSRQFDVGTLPCHLASPDLPGPHFIPSAPHSLGWAHLICITLGTRHAMVSAV